MSRAQAPVEQTGFSDEQRDLLERTAESLKDVDAAQAETAQRILEIAAHSSREESS